MEFSELNTNEIDISNNSKIKIKERFKLKGEDSKPNEFFTEHFFNSVSNSGPNMNYEAIHISDQKSNDLIRT